MIKPIGYKKFTILTIIIVAVVFFIKCMDNSASIKKNIYNNSGDQFAGSEACKNCHRNVFDHFIQTAHNLTSAPAEEATIKGSFVKDKNLFAYSYYTKVAMEKRDSGLYQVEYDKNFTEKQAYPIDIVVGSGTRGQSYLYWKDKKLFQLPVSYFTLAGQWANSPGYSVYQPVFNRSITARCLECHTTYFKALSNNNHKPAQEEFDRNQAILGVQCESCHGPAKRHVEAYEKNLSATKEKFIINPSILNRQQQIDMCAYCHGGIRQSEKAAFDFHPGDTLSYTKQDNAAVNTENIEVHDNQFALLKASKCFRMSRNMTCNTCHNTHEQERGNLVLFSKKCLSCHSVANGNFCKMSSSLGSNAITKNCIDCHMPEKPSKMLTIKTEGESNNTPATLRSHFIAVYPGKKGLVFLK